MNVKMIDYVNMKSTGNSVVDEILNTLWKCRVKKYVVKEMKLHPTYWRLFLKHVFCYYHDLNDALMCAKIEEIVSRGGHLIVDYVAVSENTEFLRNTTLAEQLLGGEIDENITVLVEFKNENAARAI